MASFRNAIVMGACLETRAIIIDASHVINIVKRVLSEQDQIKLRQKPSLFLRKIYAGSLIMVRDCFTTRANVSIAPGIFVSNMAINVLPKGINNLSFYALPGRLLQAEL